MNILNLLERVKRQIHACKGCSSCREWSWSDPRLPGFVDGSTKTGFEHICPVYPYTDGFESDTVRGKMRIMKGVLEETIQPNEEMVRKFFECTQCSNCTEHCPMTRQNKLDPAELIRMMRVHLQEEGFKPPQGIKYEVPHGPHSRRLPEDWIKPELLSSTSGLVYFPGCVISCSVYYQTPEIARDFLGLTTKLDVDINVITDGWCCGYQQYLTGQTPVAKELARRNIEGLRKMGAKTLVATCAGCYHMFKNVYPEIVGEPLGFEVLHSVEFMERLLDKGELAFRHRLEKRVAYHDTCDLGRKHGIYEAPRRILRAIPGLDLVEMEQNRENSWCCGGGGGVKSAYNGLAFGMGSDRIRQAEEVGAEMIVTSCPTCVWNLRESAENAASAVKIVDLVTLVNRVF